MRDRSKTAGNLAYLVVEMDAQATCYGGLLLVDVLGRPVEFHCSAPLTPSRAHRILYGPTLTSHLANDVVGAALLQQMRRRPAAVLIDVPDQLALRSQVHFPILLAEAGRVVDGAGGIALQCHAEHAGDRGVFERIWPRFAEQVELTEPFERVRAALREARGGNQAA